MDERLLNPISTAELERRWAAARKAMAERKIEVLLMQSSNDYARRLCALVHRYAPDRRLYSPQRDLPRLRPDDHGRHGRKGRAAQARRPRRGTPRRGRAAVHAGVRLGRLYARISGRDRRRRAQASRLSHRRLGRQRRHAAQIRLPRRARAGGKGDIRRCDRIHRPPQGHQERGGKSAHPQMRRDAGCVLRPRAERDQARHERQRAHRAGPIRGPRARQRAGDFPRLDGAARTGVALSQPPFSGAEATSPASTSRC